MLDIPVVDWPRRRREMPHSLFSTACSQIFPSHKRFYEQVSGEAQGGEYSLIGQ